MQFMDRIDAGRRLGQALTRFRDTDTVVFGLARGGVILAAEVAEALDAPFDVLVPRKLGHPWQKELAIGAVAEDGHVLLDDVEGYGIDRKWLEQAIAFEREEARRRRMLYTEGRDPVPVRGKTAILVDDGVATGFTMRLAIIEVKHRDPRAIVVAVPVISSQMAAQLQREADALVALHVPDDHFGAVGAYYDDFGTVTDEQVKDRLARPVPA